jgi:hypothetical protein
MTPNDAIRVARTVIELVDAEAADDETLNQQPVTVTFECLGLLAAGAVLALALGAAYPDETNATIDKIQAEIKGLLTDRKAQA